MGKKLDEIAQDLKNADKTVQLIYAFNGSGKTRLSRAFKDLIDPKPSEEKNEESHRTKVLYYNAFTEDLFYWDNDLAGDTDRKLIIRPNAYIDSVLKVNGQGPNAISRFQYFTSDKLNPVFNEDFTEVRFSFETGDDEGTPNIKISKGEESNFIWSIFFSLFELIIEILNTPEFDERETDQFNDLEYVFIDDPVGSLDENHLIALAVDLARLIKKSESSLKFIITTHSALFYNVLHNELGLNQGAKRKGCYLLECGDDGTFSLNTKYGDSNRSFSYHLHLKRIIEEAIAGNKIERYHFSLIRNLYEKTASFLGYKRWSNILPGDQTLYFNRIIQFTSHSTLSDYAVSEPSPEEKEVIGFLLNHLVENYSYWKEENLTDE